MKEQFVTYEIAKRLKELGFNEPCLSEFTVFKDGQRLNLNNHLKTNENTEPNVPAPLWQQAIVHINKTHLFIQEVEGDHWSLKDRNVKSYQVISGTKEGVLLRALEILS